MKATMGPRVMVEVRNREPAPKVAAMGPRPPASQTAPINQASVVITQVSKPPHPPSDMRKELMKLFRGL